MGRQRDSWNLVLTLATPTLEATGWLSGQSEWVSGPSALAPQGLAVLPLPGTFWSSGLKVTGGSKPHRTCLGLDLPSQSSVQAWALVLSTSSRIPSCSPSDPSWLGPYPQVQKLRALFDMG